MSRGEQSLTPARAVPIPSFVLAGLASTGIYLVRGIPRDLQRAARVRAARQGTTLRRVLLQALREYAAGSWTPGAPPGAAMTADE